MLVSATASLFTAPCVRSVRMAVALQRHQNSFCFFRWGFMSMSTPPLVQFREANVPRKTILPGDSREALFSLPSSFQIVIGQQ